MLKPPSKNQKAGPTSDENSSNDDLSKSGAISSDREDVERHVAALNANSTKRKEGEAAKQLDAVSNDATEIPTYRKMRLTRKRIRDLRLNLRRRLRGR